MDPDSSFTAGLAQLPGTPVSLADALQDALAHSTDAGEARAAREVARGGARTARGGFDPVLKLDHIHAKDQSLSTSSLFPSTESRTLTANGGLTWLSPVGTRLDLTLNTTRTEYDPLSISQLVSPRYDMLGEVRVTQPLLKGNGTGTLGTWRAAGRNEAAGEQTYDEALAAVRSRTEVTYWSLYAAERNLVAEQITRDRAAAFLSETDTRARIGMVGPSQVATARLFLAEQEQALLDRIEERDAWAAALATLIGRGFVDGPSVRTNSEPADLVTEAAEDSLVAQALAANHALMAARHTMEAAQGLASGARWNRLPQLDFVGSLGGRGLAGTGNTIPNPFGGGTLTSDLTGGAGDAWHDVFHREHPTWSAGLKLSVPLGFRPGAGEAQRLQGEADRVEQRFVAIQRAVEAQTRLARREMGHARLRLEAARTGVEAGLEQYRIGLLQFRAGRSTAFELVRLSADLAGARQRQSQALVRVAQSAARLRQLTAGE